MRRLPALAPSTKRAWPGLLLLSDACLAVVWAASVAALLLSSLLPLAASSSSSNLSRLFLLEA